MFSVSIVVQQKNEQKTKVIKKEKLEKNSWG